MDNDNLKNTFFSPQNLDFTFNQIKDDVIKKTSYDITQKPVFKNSYNKLAQIIYDKTPETDMNLISLNNRLQDKCGSYFHSLILKKRKGHPKGDRPDQFMPPIDPVSTNESTAKSAQGLSKIDCIDQASPVGNDTRQLDVNGINDSVLNRTDGRNQLGGTSIAMESSPIDPLADTRVIPDDDAFNFGTSTFTPTQTTQTTQTLYNNLAELEQAEKMSPMDRMKLYEAERSKPLNLHDSHGDSFVLGRDAMLLDVKHRNASAEPLELLKQQYNTEKILLEGNTGSNFRLPQQSAQPSTQQSPQQSASYHVVDVEKDRLLESIINHKLRNEPKYIEKTHFVSVNSLDRDLSISKNNRYQFKVNLGVVNGQGTLGVNSSFKNITSVEILDVMIPYDTNIVPYDNRIFLSPLSYPYLLLHIDELKGVYTGTNTSTERVFSHLTLDKDHSSIALSSDYTTSNVNITDYAGGAKTTNTYDLQFKRGYLRFHPSFFDKKSFLNAPLATLNRMTIKITDPFGNLINTQPDVVDISAVAFEAAADKAIDATVGFPRTNIASYKICKITTTNKFSNRLFRIGDRIRIESLESDNSQFQTFMNREEGHIIINLDSETNKNDETGDNGNRGYINNIYISPPGELDSTNGTLDTTTYSETTGTVSSYGRLVNTNLQTHLIFKITTRETDAKSVIQPQNI